MENTKLHVKIGNSEFNGEGPQDWVKEAYERFLDSLSTAPKESLTAQYSAASAGIPLDAALQKTLLERAFIVKDEFVSLRHLPNVETANRNADAAILLLFGFKRLLQVEDVPVTKLNEGLRQSGISIERLDKIISVHSQLYRKGGQRSAGRYSLTNAGETQAERWLKLWFSE
ncbi:MAG: hypothetical protein WAM91_13205 [Candidatus Acidiferrales bacterium]